jgi:hypothetical protein
MARLEMHGRAGRRRSAIIGGLLGLLALALLGYAGLDLYTGYVRRPLCNQSSCPCFYDG